MPQRVCEFAEILSVIPIEECTRHVGEKSNQPDDRPPQWRELHIPGQKVFFALCIFDIPSGPELSGRSTSSVPNPGLRDEVSTEPGLPDLFGNDQFFKIQEGGLIK